MLQSHTPTPILIFFLVFRCKQSRKYKKKMKTSTERLQRDLPCNCTVKHEQEETDTTRQNEHHYFVTCRSLGSGCWAGFSKHSVSKSFWVLGSGLCVTMLSVQMFSCINSILLLFLSWMQFALYHHTLVLLKMKVMSTSPLHKICIAILLHNFVLPHKLKSPDCSQSVAKDKSMFD